MKVHNIGGRSAGVSLMKSAQYGKPSLELNEERGTIRQYQQVS